MIRSLAGVTPTLAPGAWVAPSADVIGDVILAAGASVWFGAVIRGDNGPISIGDRANIQDGAVLHADPGFPLSIGADVTIGHRAVVHGCTVGEGALIGMGAIVLNGAAIGPGCLVGAGALVTEGKRFEPGQLILGAPAKAVRPLREDERAGLLRSAAGYVERTKRYAAGLT